MTREPDAIDADFKVVETSRAERLRDYTLTELYLYAVGRKLRPFLRRASDDWSYWVATAVVLPLAWWAQHAIVHWLKGIGWPW